MGSIDEATKRARKQNRKKNIMKHILKSWTGSLPDVLLQTPDQLPLVACLLHPVPSLRKNTLRHSVSLLWQRITLCLSNQSYKSFSRNNNQKYILVFLVFYTEHTFFLHLHLTSIFFLWQHSHFGAITIYFALSHWTQWGSSVKEAKGKILYGLQIKINRAINTCVLIIL